MRVRSNHPNPKPDQVPVAGRAARGGARPVEAPTLTLTPTRTLTLTRTLTVTRRATGRGRAAWAARVSAQYAAELYAAWLG